MMKKMTGIIMLLCFIMLRASAQEESLLKDIEDSLPATQKVTGAFRSTRVINAHSVEMLAKGNLDFRIMHRFGFVSDGVKQFFGLDQASMRMSFDYGITDNLMVGIGRSTFRKELDAFVKTRLVQQTKGAHVVPVSVVLAAGYTVHTEENFDSIKRNIVDRSAYYVQLVVGRKFNDVFSLQLSPILVHTNIPFNSGDDRKIFALGGGARFSLSKRVALTLDYHHPFGKLAQGTTNPVSLGVDISTGGHVFQLQFSNSTGMNERAYITQTNGHFFKGDIRFGFNLSRIFQVGKRKEQAKTAVFLPNNNNIRKG